MNKSLDNLCGLLTIKKIITLIQILFFVIIVIITLYKFTNLTINTNAKPAYEITKIENKNLKDIEKKTEKVESENVFNSTTNLTEFAMTKIIAHDHVKFNSLGMFYFFKKKYFNITNFNYFYSEKFKKVKLVYDIGIYDENENIIHPSDFTLYDKFSTLCYLKLFKPKKFIYSLPQIVENKYYECVEYFDLNEKIKVGVHFYHPNRITFLSLQMDFDELMNFKDQNHLNDDIFDCDFVEENYDILLRNSKNPLYKANYRLKSYYMKKPECNLKRKAIEDNEGWIYKNLYNNYFCFCVGKHCTKGEVKQKCKFHFYKSVIDNNRDVYPKTDYIFVDFIFKGLPSDDTFPVFEKMNEQNISVHYITEKEELDEEFCGDEKRCQKIIPMNRLLYYKYGDFLEKYLTLMLKLKAVVSCKESTYHKLSFLFYRIEYVNYICMGHGANFFKDYLFGKYRIYGRKINNKIVIPPSPILLNFPIKYGWPEQDIIKINLPRWDRYSNVDYYFPGNVTSNSILVMFTWRFTRFWLGYRKLSNQYHENIIKILGNKKLNEALEQKNMTLYFSLHRFVNRRFLKKYDEVIENNTHLQYLKQNQLSECLAKTNLVLSDFSSIIFDLMTRGKPFVIYVPDSEDEKIKTIYTKDYIRLIENMKNDVINFKNKCKTIGETIDKIVNYINNDFKLEPDLKKFYDSFNFKIQNNTNEFIEYLINSK